MTERRLRLWRRAQLGAAAVLLLALFAALWLAGVPLLYRNAGSDANATVAAISTTRVGLLTALVGVAALGALCLAVMTYKIKVLTLGLTEQGQLADRYSEAGKQLGSENPVTRLAGVVALEWIAVDSKRHPAVVVAVVKLLSGFIREHTDPERASSNSPSSSVTNEVQVALTVLGSLPNREGLCRADLTGANLAGADLRGANLTRANLTATILNDADLTGANLTRATLRAAKLNRATLRDARVAHVDLTGAHLYGADLTLATSDLDESATSAQIEHAKGDKATMLPAGIRRPSSWLDAPPLISLPALQLTPREYRSSDTGTYRPVSGETETFRAITESDVFRPVSDSGGYVAVTDSGGYGAVPDMSSYRAGKRSRSRHSIRR